MEKSRYVRIIKRKEFRRDDPIEYFLHTGVRSTFRAPKEVMAVVVPQNEEISIIRCHFYYLS